MKNPLLALALVLGFGVVANLGFDAFIQLLLIYTIVNMILGMSLNLVNGFTGQFSLGHAGFMAVGAYTSAYLSFHFRDWTGETAIVAMPFLAVAGGLSAGLAGLVVGLPSLRLKGDYLAIVTLGFGEIIRVVLLNSPAVGGARGYYGIPGAMDIELGPMVLSKFFVGFAHSALWLVITFVVIWRVVRSAHGRAFLSVREDEIAASAVGIDTTSAKVRAFALSSFFAGVAGSLFAHYANYLNPSSFSFNRSVDAIIIVVLGGMGSLSGSLIAAIFVTAMPELLRPLQEITGVDLRMVIYSLSLILLMILRPKGLFGSEELLSILRKKYGRKAA